MVSLSKAIETVPMDALVRCVKNHAQQNYNSDGWDYLVECYDDSDIAEMIAECKAITAKQAITYVGGVLKDKDDYRSDIMGTAF